MPITKVDTFHKWVNDLGESEGFTSSRQSPHAFRRVLLAIPADSNDLVRRNKLRAPSCAAWSTVMRGTSAATNSKKNDSRAKRCRVFHQCLPTISLCGEIVILVCERKWRKPMATLPIHSYDSISPNLIVGAKFMLICRDDLRQIGQHRSEGKDFKLIEQLRGMSRI